MLETFLKALVIGFSIAAPVGPIGILCIHRSLRYGQLAGFITGCGAATADGIYGAVAGFGLTFISGFLVSHQSWIRLVGGVFLLYLSIKTFLSKPVKDKTVTDKNSKLIHAYLTTVFLTLTNPMTILSFVAIFAGLGLGSAHVTYSEAAVLVSGVVLGSLFWWLLLSTGIARLFRKRINDKTLKLINYFSGLILMLFGTYALISLI